MLIISLLSAYLTEFICTFNGIRNETYYQLARSHIFHIILYFMLDIQNDPNYLEGRGYARYEFKDSVTMGTI